MKPTLAAVLLLLSLLAPMPSVLAQADASPCTVDLRKPGQMRDILSNALVRGLSQNAAVVRRYLDGTFQGCADGDELLRLCAKKFSVPVKKLRAEVERFRHVNCSHPGGGGEGALGCQPWTKATLRREIRSPP